MAETTHTPHEPKHGTTRRGFLGHIAGVATAGAIIHVVLPDAVSAHERIEAATDELLAAMTDLHGEGCQLIRNGNHIVSVLEPHKPRIVEYAGEGLYEVERSKTARPIYYVERSPLNDSASLGRYFKLTPEYAKSLGAHFMFEGDLRLALIRKI